MIARFAAVACLCLATTPARAFSYYDCNFAPPPHSGISPSMILAYEPGRLLEVADGAIMNVHGHPITPKIQRETTTRLVLSWELRLAGTNGGRFRVAYTLSLNKHGGDATVTSRPLPYDNSYGVTGRCTLSMKNAP